jgi:hypothetical protein
MSFERTFHDNIGTGRDLGSEKISRKLKKTWAVKSFWRLTDGAGIIEWEKILFCESLVCEGADTWRVFEFDGAG